MGHATGNEVLCEIASRWSNAAKNGETGTLDIFTRQGGDEFSLIIRDYKNNNDILKTINYYSSILEERITINGYDFYMTASFGYVEFPIDTTKVDSLFSYADAAMYQVKADNSSNHILRFTPELVRKDHTLETERTIRTALSDDLIFFNLQPQFDMDHKLRGFEALARMHDTDGNNVSPGEFIPVAEKVGLIDKVDGIVYKKAGKFIGDLIKQTGSNISLSINVSVRHLMKNDFLTEIDNLLISSGILQQRAHLRNNQIMVGSNQVNRTALKRLRTLSCIAHHEHRLAKSRGLLLNTA
jgi:diguanylate cyclase (GGDEF)-like protein